MPVFVPFAPHPSFKGIHRLIWIYQIYGLSTTQFLKPVENSPFSRNREFVPDPLNQTVLYSRYKWLKSPNVFDPMHSVWRFFPRSISFNTLYVSGLLRALFFVMNGNSSTACCKSSAVTERTVLSLPKISCKIWIFLLTRFLESADLFLREFWLLYTSANASNVISGFNGVLNNIGEETIFSPVSPEGTPTAVFCRPDYGKQSVHSIPHNTMSHDYKGSSLPAKFKGCLLTGLLTVLIDSAVQKSQVRLFSTTWPLKWLGNLDSNQD